jgi:hypothetical protein
MRRFYLLLAAVVLALALAPASIGQTHNTCRDKSLPADARSLIAKKFPDWRPKDVSDLSADDQQLWLKAHPKECPGVAFGHFEKPDSLAYGILLVPKSEVNGGYKIVVLSKVATADAYSLRMLDHAEGQPYSSSGLVISKAAPGAYSDFEETKSLRLKLDAVNVEWIEKGAVLYYWSQGRYRTVQTSD